MSSLIYILSFPPLHFLLAAVLSYFFSFVSFRHMTSASLQPWTYKDTGMPRIDTLPLIQSYSCCANAEPILTALEERNGERERKWQGCVWRWRLALPIKLFSRPSALCLKIKKRILPAVILQNSAVKRIPRGHFYGSEIALSGESGVQLCFI